MSIFSKKSTLQLAILLLLCLAFFIIKRKQSISVPTIQKTETSAPEVKNTTDRTEETNKLNKQVPERVLKALKYILQNNKAPESTVGGRIFGNRERHLPLNDQTNHRIIYREWDVNPKVSGQNRGVERLITGSDQSAYYTNDHYRTFIKIKM